MGWSFMGESLSSILNLLGVVALVVGLSLMGLVWRWRKEYRRRIVELDAKVSGRKAGAAPLTRMVRATSGQGGVLTHENSQLLKLSGVLDLREEWRNREGGGGVPPPGQPKVGLCSLGDYLASLRPETNGKNATNCTAANGKDHVVEEVDILLTHAILKGAGPTVGQAVLPLLGEINAAGSLVRLAASKGVVACPEEASVGVIVHQLLARAWDAMADISIMGIGFGADTYATYARSQQTASEQKVAVAKANGFGSDKTTPLLAADDLEKGMAPAPNVHPMQLPALTWALPPASEKDARDAVSLMRWGEARKETFPAEAFPNPFVMETDFDKAMTIMMDIERKVVEKNGVKYDPDAYPIDVPTPIDPVTLPGLHKGFGGTVRTQTYREILCARMLNVLLNRLAANDTQGSGDAKFVVSINRKEARRPDELIEGLISSGHSVSTRPRFNTVSFGYGLCVKEDDGSWTNIPWALVLRSGYEDCYGRPAHCALNHGGININIQGPIVKKASTQHHSAIDGLTGWYTNDTCNVPWLAEKIELGDGPLVGVDCVRAARLVGLYATVLNCVATKLRLPSGGYGLTGVCLDSSAVIEKALFGTSNSYPMLHVGRFHMHAIREARSFLKSLQASGDDRVGDMKSIIAAMESLPTDTGATPSMGADAARRIISCTPKSMPFKIMERSVEACKTIIAEQETYNGDANLRLMKTCSNDVNHQSTKAEV